MQQPVSYAIIRQAFIVRGPGALLSGSTDNLSFNKHNT